MAGYGFHRDIGNSELDIQVAGTAIAAMGTSTITLGSSVGVTVTDTGLIVTAGGLAITAGRMRETTSEADLNAQDGTILAADILEGIFIHTSTTGQGTITMDTAANIISGVPLSSDGESVICYFINDGNQTVDFATAGSCTVVNTSATVLINGGALMVFNRTSGTAVDMVLIN